MKMQSSSAYIESFITRHCLLLKLVISSSLCDLLRKQHKSCFTRGNHNSSLAILILDQRVKDTAAKVKDTERNFNKRHFCAADRHPQAAPRGPWYAYIFERLYFQATQVTYIVWAHALKEKNDAASANGSRRCYFYFLGFALCSLRAHKRALCFSCLTLSFALHG